MAGFLAQENARTTKSKANYLAFGYHFPDKVDLQRSCLSPIVGKPY